MAIINWTNITDFGQLPAAANTASNGSFWVGMLYMVWVVIMVLNLYYGFEVAIVVSSFACLVTGMLLVYAGLVAWTLVMPFAGILVIMFLYIIWTSRKLRV